jgi:polo-like kinase 1
MSLTARSTRRSSDYDPHCQIIEERISKIGGDSSVRRYKKGKFLGKGGFARVYDFTNLDTEKTYAAKLITKASLTKSRAK